MGTACPPSGRNSTYPSVQISGTSSNDLTYARIVSTAFALVSVLSVAFSPVLTSELGRLWAAALYLGALASVWILQGLYMDSYHTIAGAFVVCGLGLFVMPAWFGRVSSWICAGFASQWPPLQHIPMPRLSLYSL
jgi:hypothetical protein